MLGVPSSLDPGTAQKWGPVTLKINLFHPFFMLIWCIRAMESTCNLCKKGGYSKFQAIKKIVRGGGRLKLKPPNKQSNNQTIKQSSATVKQTDVIYKS